MDQIQEVLFQMQDIEYKEFMTALIPTVDPNTVIGVRMPKLKQLAKRLVKENRTLDFLQDLPHKYYEENNLHGFIIALEKDFDLLSQQLNRFLPYVDNWATCDSIRPVIFKNHHKELIHLIQLWIQTNHEYTVRFGLEMLMLHYLEGDFKEEYLEWALKISANTYYLKMMQAWFFATALAKQWDSTIIYLEERRLNPWVHRKSIQKAIESYRISEEQKIYLKTLG